MPRLSDSALFDHFRVIGRYGRWIAALVLGVGLGAYVADAATADTYRATVTVRLVVPEVATSGSSARDSADLLAISYTEAARGETFAARVQGTGAALTVDEVEDRVKVTQNLIPGFLTVTAKAGSADGAATLADQSARAVVELIRDEQEQVVSATLAPSRGRLDDVVKALADPAVTDAQRQLLSEQALRLEASLAEQEQRLRPTVLAPEPAAVPTSPYAPKPLRKAITMGLIAFVVATESIVLARYLRGLLPLGDPAGELGRLTGTPVLELGAVRRRRSSTPVLPYVLQHLGGRKVITVVQQSGSPTTLPGSLVADALSRAGSRVLLVDGDTNHPRLHTELDVPLSPGVVEVVSGDERLGAAVHASPTGSGVVVLSAGAATDASAVSAVANGGLDALVRHAGADISVVVTSSATPTEDALLVVHQFPEAVVLSVDARSARRAEVVESVRVIRSIGGNLVGTLCVHSQPRGWRNGLARLRRAA